MLFICFFQACLKFYDKIYERFLVCFYILYQSLQINMVLVINFDFKGQYMHQVLLQTAYNKLQNAYCIRYNNKLQLHQVLQQA